jgi:hypothetical protein
MMGELQFLLGLQIKQSKEGTFVHEAKYRKDILKKFKMDDSKPLSTPMSMTTVLDMDEDGEPVDQNDYRSMIGSLLYLTTMRLDIDFSVCLCARFQASPRTSHRQAASCCSQLLWITYTLSDFGEQCSHVPLMCDSTSSISVAKTPCFTPEPNT